MTQKLTVIMNGVTGRMGYRQHLVRSVVAIREQGGVLLENGKRVQVDPVLVGRDAAKLARIAQDHGDLFWTTDLGEVLPDPAATIYFDAQITSERVPAVLQALAAGKNVYTEKPIAESSADALRLARAAAKACVTVGVVHDKLYLPGLIKLRQLIEDGFFGRILSVHGEFGYWVWEGPEPEPQRPSWNYRAEDGGGIVVDMFCHWQYVLANLIGPIEAITARTATHIPVRYDEAGRRYEATADDAAYAIFELAGGVVAQVNSSWATRVDRDELVEFQVDGTDGSAVAGLRDCRIQSRAATPTAVWDPDVPDPLDYRAAWTEVPELPDDENGFKVQWEEFIRDVVAGRPHPYDFMAGARGIQLAEAGLESAATGTRVVLKDLAPPSPAGATASK